MCKRMKFDLYLTSYVKTNAKWMRDLNKGPKIVKILQKYEGKAS